MEELLNFYQITEHIGTAGQPTQAQFTDIAAAGYRAVVNLAMPDSDNAIEQEGSIVSALGMTYVHIPVPFEAPTAAHLRQFCGVMEVLEGDPVFVHCAVNARVSAFMHQYLTLKKGVSSEQATSPLLRRWLPEMDDKWQLIMALEAGDLH